VKPKITILDTDIGTDIDDSWALALLLASPELDLRLITTVSGDVRYRAGLCAGLLAAAGRTNIPIGLGIGGDLKVPAALQGPLLAGVGEEAALNAHPCVIDDGVEAMIQTIMEAEDEVTVIGIGPFTNIAKAIRRRPEIVQRARFVGMCGSVRIGYRGSETASAEYNVFADIAAAQAVLSAAWDITIAPLDSCGHVLLAGEDYQRFYNFATGHPNSTAAEVMAHYRQWLSALKAPADQLVRRSTTQYDAVAIYLAISEAGLEMEKLPIRVTDEGLTRLDETGRLMAVATGWRDRAAFDQMFIERLCREPS
jgi:inosine-uridine nucleoside N-ribohydrolase